MLSICIPIYNYDIRPLFYNLIKQKSTLTIPIEIVLADDGSDYSYTSINEEIASLADVYLKMDKNVGRAKIRNILSDNAQYDYLLFIDCDSVIVSDTFLSDYVAQIDGKEKVVYGGVCYSDNASWNEKLRYLYGLKRECRSLEFRNSHPYQTFLSGNFLIHKKVFEKVRFDETIVAYGYEDALFSWALYQNGVPMYHINNPLENRLVSNKCFLKQCSTAVRNLSYMVKNDNFPQNVRLVKIYNKIKSFHMANLCAYVSYAINPLIYALLYLNVPFLFLLDAYKLSLFCRYMKS
jgi:hypothetical protein